MKYVVCFTAFYHMEQKKNLVIRLMGSSGVDIWSHSKEVINVSSLQFLEPWNPTAQSKLLFVASHGTRRLLLSFVASANISNSIHTRDIIPRSNCFLHNVLSLILWVLSKSFETKGDPGHEWACVCIGWIYVLTFEIWWGPRHCWEAAKK